MVDFFRLSCIQCDDRVRREDIEVKIVEKIFSTDEYVGTSSGASTASTSVPDVDDGVGLGFSSAEFASGARIESTSSPDNEDVRGRFSSQRSSARHDTARSDFTSLSVKSLDISRYIDYPTIKPWRPNDFIDENLLEEAPGNSGFVRCMMRKSDSTRCAVKVMPNLWITSGPKEHMRKYPRTAERPWTDIGMLTYLNEMKYEYACELFGVFNDDHHTRVVTSLASEGDLFSWCQNRAPKPGAKNEEVVLPLMVQIFTAIQMLHNLNIAHRDLSMENIVLTIDDHSTQQLKVKVIDFAQASSSQFCESDAFGTGKGVYKAPELHKCERYDAFLADNFALGVILLSLLAKRYFWSATADFEKVHRKGFLELWRSYRSSRGAFLIQAISLRTALLIHGLLQSDPQERFTLGENCYTGGPSETVWEHVLSLLTCPTTVCI
jgi:hypothetical protein